MADTFTMVGQDQTEVFESDRGQITIQQWDPQEGAYDIVRFDPLFVPTLIKWLQELIAPEAVG
ncbi:MAG: hypothetical protein IPK44_01340 [Candidatus Accumulibacter sp.]|uniref:hypothetical protein n=1 Tax=Accumulibacter sp. TaxID=2053492 RepID=UPI00258707A8|nr:hypothetical protein [Accumulibacter sp.]MBK8113243.1 hypothetical protein [Accumulibacter sp.]